MRRAAPAAAASQIGVASGTRARRDQRVDAAREAGDRAAVHAGRARDQPAVVVCSQEGVVAVDARFKDAPLGPYGALATLPDREVEP